MNTEPLNLYRLTQTQRRGYDTYDSVIVAAKDEESAKKIHPSVLTGWPEHSLFCNRSWCDNPEYVTVELIGSASTNITEGVILASFNAG